jgi:hypothetical protein
MIFYYLEDHATGAILFIHRDPYLVSNLKSGILDCYLHVLSNGEITATLLHTHSNPDTILKMGPDRLVELPMTDLLRKKQEYIKLRAPAFELLLKVSEKYRNKNLYGFHISDMSVIQNALSNQSKLEEYAQVMGIDTTFAKSELSMIVESVYIDQFKIFTVCNLWKQRINTCTDANTMQQYMPLIAQSFSLDPDIPNVQNNLLQR